MSSAAVLDCVAVNVIAFTSAAECSAALPVLRGRHRVVAFVASLLASLVFIALPFAYGKRRPLGTPVTWGEAMAGSLYIFFVLFWVYGVMPHQFLAWTDGPLKWRSDAIGIPAGPLRNFLSSSTENHWYSHKTNSFWPTGVTFMGRGRVMVTKEAVRDFVAANIYIVFLGVHMKIWVLWQKRGQAAAKKAAIEPVSSYGRPLTKKA